VTPLHQGSTYPDLSTDVRNPIDPSTDECCRVAGGVTVGSEVERWLRRVKRSEHHNPTIPVQRTISAVLQTSLAPTSINTESSGTRVPSICD
jgi:hypothetical protein